jgi:anti-sigma-K factor RskA
MDHEDVLEQLELAAVEPGGLDRLMAGDTAMAAAVVGHVAGCDACTEELRRLSQAVPLVRDLVRTTPPADLRERTLAYVKAHGRVRGASEDLAAAAAATSALSAATTPTMVRPTRPRTERILRWVVAAAAAIAIAVGSLAALDARNDAERQASAVAALEAVNRATLEITRDTAARRVDLASTGGAATSGTLLYSPSTTELVVVATDLARPPSGKEYRCWVEVDGQRENVGKMFFAGDLAFWIGDTPAVGDLPDGTAFGVSLTDVANPTLEADPVIRGEL